MALDGVFLTALSSELHHELRSGRITKIYQPTKLELVFHIRKERSNRTLLVSAHPSSAAVYITEQKFEQPDEPPRFCMLLRKHCEGGFIEEIEQIERDRIIRFTIRNKNELGDTSYKHLYVEIMGKHSNILLCDAQNGAILDSMKSLGGIDQGQRTLLPGFRYELPTTQTKQDPFIDLPLQLNDWTTESEFVQFSVSTLQGVSPFLAKEVWREATEKEILPTMAFQSIFQRVKNHEIVPTLYKGEKKWLFYWADFQYVEGERVHFASLSTLLDVYFTTRVERERIKELTNHLDRFVQKEIQRNKKKLKKLEESLLKAEDAEKYRVIGELLQIELYAIKKGQQKVSITNYYEEDCPKMTVSLDPKKTPIENVQSYFQKYTKLKNSIPYIEEQWELAENEISYFETIHQQLMYATVKEAEEIKTELEQEGYLKAQKVSRKKKKQKPGKIELTEFVSSDGFAIFVGKNNIQNEYVTMKSSLRSHWWFHTKDIPGSHVVIRDEHPSDTAIREAATIAAYFSKAKQSGSVPVDYTQIRNVKKPSGAKPGFVTYDNQKTIYVDPSETLINELLKK